jgi:CRISPR-associated exonuclease Cas4
VRETGGQSDLGKLSGDQDLIPISALQHAVYCIRQAALIHLERVWIDNRLTAEGQVTHKTVNISEGRHARGVRRVHALQLSALLLGITGVADIVEFHKSGGVETPYPIEVKRGKPKLHRADEVQLCAQALCLEEMTDKPVPEGALFYAQTKRRLAVPFDNDLRALTLDTIADLRRVFENRKAPSVTYKADRCRACSLLEVCRPRVTGKSVLAWRSKTLEAHLSSPAPSEVGDF